MKKDLRSRKLKWLRFIGRLVEEKFWASFQKCYEKFMETDSMTNCQNLTQSTLNFMTNAIFVIEQFN